MSNTSSNSTSSTIGIFDSGLGGLTILNQLKSDYMTNKFIYFGDTAHLPYGNKGKESIIQFSDNIVKFLLSKGADIIIIACHTASSVALNFLQKKYNIPIIGVVESSIDAAIHSTKSNEIAILGTHTTISAHSYRHKILNRNNKIKVHEIKCPLFVPLVEEGLEESELSLLAAKLYLNHINSINIDTMVLGCTHYPILINTIKKVITADIQIIDTGLAISQDLNNFIISSNKLNGVDSYYVTDIPYRFNELASKFLKYNITDVKHVSL